MDNEILKTDGVVPGIKDKRPTRWRLIVAVIVVAAFVVFVVQNGAKVNVTWLFIDTTAPLWVVIVVAAVIGALLHAVIDWIISRARRRRM